MGSAQDIGWREGKWDLNEHIEGSDWRKVKLWQIPILPLASCNGDNYTLSAGLLEGQCMSS